MKKKISSGVKINIEVWNEEVEEKYDEVDEKIETRAQNTEAIMSAIERAANQHDTISEKKDVYEKAKEVLLALKQENDEKLNKNIEMKNELDNDMKKAMEENQKQADIEHSQADNLGSLKVDDLNTDKLEQTVNEMNGDANEYYHNMEEIRRNLALRQQQIDEKIRRARLQKLK